ncbi:DUF4332 domain-containing protein [Henriciella sp.]|uniref:DUF4332 domain-containing protein n=1 Tax=Henriciella sp. TaxID=1968823 RepID=UPI0026302578|nr:DUF4332 domain-containing protein [Henriciella sp.]
MANLLRNVITAHHCRSTHHFIVMDALALIEGKDAERWHDLMLSEHPSLLAGAKAPDSEFRDFRNHVLHVSEGEWGGARDAAADWYGKAVVALREKKWSHAAYALGVLSHYYADPIQPFHTAQSEEEGAIHRALEWSIAKSRGEIVRRIEQKGYPDIERHCGSGFVSDMVLAGAKRSHPHYQDFIDHYDIHAGVKDPPAGLDETLLDIISDLVAYATRGISLLYENAFAEAAVTPKKVNLTVRGYLATLDVPVQWMTKKMENAADRKTVAAMYKELQETGKVVKTLPDDDKAIRKLHAETVLRIPVKELDARPLAPLGSKHAPRMPIPENITEQTDRSAPETIDSPAPAPAAEAPEAEATPDTHLTLKSDVVDAPSIGKKTAARLYDIGIYTIRDLLGTDPETTAEALDARHITAETVLDWQDQTALKMSIPSLRVHDVQLLVGAGIRSADDLAEAKAADLLMAATMHFQKPYVRRIISDNNAPNADEVDHWIDLAKDSV